jgi:hypothetical protein
VILQILLAILALTCLQCGKDSSPHTQAQTAPTPPKPETQGPSDASLLPEHREFQSLAEAMKEIVRSNPKVIGFGEFHQLEGSAAVKSALGRFTDAIFPELAPTTAHLILETWSVDPNCGKPAAKVEKTVRKDIERPKSTETELERLLKQAVQNKVGAHPLEFSCEEYKGLLDETGVNYERLLSAITNKLGEQARFGFERVAKNDKRVLLYGGSTHNDLYPAPGLEGWSYASGIATKSGQRYVEVDLYVPEYVEGNEVLSKEAWYPLLKRAHTDKVLLIERGPSSYIVILRKGLTQKPESP